MQYRITRNGETFITGGENVSSNDIEHFKYIDKKKGKNGKWIYYYDKKSFHMDGSTNIDAKNKRKHAYNLIDAYKLNKEAKEDKKLADALAKSAGYDSGEEADKDPNSFRNRKMREKADSVARRKESEKANLDAHLKKVEQQQFIDAIKRADKEYKEQEKEEKEKRKQEFKGSVNAFKKKATKSINKGKKWLTELFK